MKITSRACYLILFLLIETFSIKAATFKNGKTIFSQDKLHEIHLTFSQPHYWDSLLLHYNSSHDSAGAINDAVMANVVIDGTKIDSIGVHLKSYSSFAIPSKKKPIKFHFNEFVKGKNYEGLHRLNLSNEFPDPSMLRNTIAGNVLRKAGAMAPRTSFAKVFINDEYFGLYVLIEQIDKEFLENYFDSPNGDLIKPLSSFLYWFPEDDIESFKNNFEVKSKNISEANSNLFSFAKKINMTAPYYSYDSLKSDFEFSSYLPVLAADIVFNNWDSYFYGINYFLYRDSSQNKYYYLPWDYNMSLNNYEISGGDYSILPGGKSDRLFILPLPSHIVDNKKLKKDYLDNIARINQYFSEDSLKETINRLHNLIKPALIHDPGKIFTMTEYDNSLFQPVAISEFEFVGLMAFIRYRHRQVEEMLLRSVR